MLGLIPLPYRLIALGIALALLCGSSYFLGRKHVRQAWDAANAVAAAEAARLKGQQEERERMWQGALQTAGEKYDERARIANGDFDASLSRLRNAYSSRPRVQPSSTVTPSCSCPSGPTASDILRAGEELAAIVRDADRDRAALEACVSGWPK